MARKKDDHAPEHPGRILLKRAMEPLGISRNRLARDINVPVGRISDITNGKRGVTADTALRLARYFGTAPELWLRLQADYDLHVVRNSVWPEIAPRVRVLEEAASEPDAPASGTLRAAPAGPEDGAGPEAAVSEIQPMTESDSEPGGAAAGESDELVIPPAPER